VKKRIFSVLYMFLITLVFTSVVSGVKYFSEERIQRNEKLKLQKVILEVLGMDAARYAPDEEVVRVFQRRIRTVEVGDRKVYTGYQKDGKSIQGYAFHVGGAGFWGPIRGMVGVDPDARKIIGLKFYKHSETPGLGARITEAWFQKQFEGLPLEITTRGRKLFLLKPEGTGKEPYELDAITGATGTSRAVQAFLNEELRTFGTKLREAVGRG
jgi:Na+-transporting NADH:ubiquinone oxidoreductase subunit C